MVLRNSLGPEPDPGSDFWMDPDPKHCFSENLQFNI